ncbi:polyketide synthase [Xylaria arbuscula]|nr:polyketide synthase [Xylaria arbuscula]
MGLRLPAGVNDGETFWDLLVNGRDARAQIPASRYAVEGFDGSLNGQGTIPMQHGYFLENDISCLDNSFFSMSKSELERCDPQERQLLEVVRECLEDAGEVNYRGQRIGCYIGAFSDDWRDTARKDPQHMGTYTMAGYIDIMLANRISYEYDLRGPSLVVKTGCSSSLVALHQAIQELQSETISAAIVGGTSILMDPDTMSMMFAEGILSPDASCKTFDASADGYARAEGIIAILIKPLKDALRDGNPVQAVIRATGSNHDGRSQGLLAPRGEIQEVLMREVYERAKLNPRSTAFVECHGTGTATGDPIEAQAVGNVFGDRELYIGSVKPNVGHSEGYSGLSSLIKAVLALKNHTIPPNIKFSQPNPKIPFAEKSLIVPIHPTPFPKTKAERISINSFGIGGSNAHVILDSVAQYLHDTSKASSSYSKDPCPSANDTGDSNGGDMPSGLEILLFSANTSASLQRQMQSYHQYIIKHPDDVADVAYTLALRRERLPHRSFTLVHGGSVVEDSGLIKSPSPSPQITFVFTGQGAQWPGMGRELIMTNQAFRQDIIRMDEVLHGLKKPPTWSIIEELMKPETTSRIHCAELAQPLCTALQIALVRQFQRLHVVPAAVVGHSSGEIAAAYAAGYISLEYAITVAYYRGLVTTHGKAARKGGMMAAVGMGAGDISPFLQPGVCIACENSPTSTTISGDREAVHAVLTSVEKEHPDVLARPLKVDIAYHSHHMSFISNEYRDLIDAEDNLPTAGSKTESVKALFISSVTANPVDEQEDFTSAYWVNNLISPVRFNDAVSRLLVRNTLPVTTILQIWAAKQQQHTYVPSQVRGENSVRSFLVAAGRLYQESVPVSLEALFPGDRKVLAGLPRYPWDYGNGSIWYESRLSRAWRMRKYTHHCLLGIRTVESPDTIPQWRNVLHLEQVPWISNHKVYKDIVFPFACYVAMVGETVRQITGCETGYHLRHVMARNALIMTDTKPIELVTTLRRYKLTDADHSDWFDFSIVSYNGPTWTTHCEEQAMSVHQIGTPTRAFPCTMDKLPRHVAKSRFYDAMARVGFGYGPEFQPLGDISSSVSDNIAEARIALSGTQSSQAFPMHPASIDGCIQLAACVANVNGQCRNISSPLMPVRIETIQVLQGMKEMRARARWNKQSNIVECVTAENSLVLRISGIQTKTLEQDVLNQLVTTDVHAAARLQWLPDFDFIDVSKSIEPPVCNREGRRLQEKLCLLCILESADKLTGLNLCQPHFSKYRDWLHLQIGKARVGEYQLVEQASYYVALPPAQRRKCLETTFERLLGFPGKHGVAICIKHVLMSDNALFEMYSSDNLTYGKFVRLLSHTRPNLRILEVGAGTGATTDLLLRHISDGSSLPFYSQYMFTDISAGFFSQARERFAYAANMDFQVLDISKEPLAQGFAAASYDLILAGNVVHATPYLVKTLRNLKSLLKPDGILVLTEFGNFSGWWLGQDDDRFWEPYVSEERWAESLQAAGFTSLEAVVADDEKPYQQCVAMVSRPCTTEVAKPEKSVTLVCQYPREGVSWSIASTLRNEGWIVTECKMGERLPLLGQDIIACVDLETPVFGQDMTEESFSAFQDLVRHLSTERILWLTPRYQIQCQVPNGAQTLGVTRALRAELDLNFFTLEIDYQRELQAGQLVVKLFNKVRRSHDVEILNSDKEFVVSNGVIHIGRYSPFGLTEEMKITDVFDPLKSSKSLHISKIGTLNSLEWHDKPMATTLDDDAVEIEVHAAGLNFHDLLLAMGTIPPQASDRGISLGIEATGVVQHVGPQVRSLHAGDRVMVLASTGTLSTRVVAPAALTIRIPDTMSLNAAAAAPACFTTVLIALLDVGRLQREQSVLVHSACGGVGLAALQVCQMVGANVFATVGSEEKIDYLMKSHRVPREHIFSSRDASFLDGVIRETGGRGADLVLNSLSGELLHKSWACVAEFGTMIELGKRDILGAGRLDMAPFLANRSYAAVDIHQFIRERPERVGQALSQYLNMYNEGQLQLIEPISYFDAGAVEQAFRYLQNRDHIGKVVVTIPRDFSQITSVSHTRPITLDPHATYLLVGGSKGLGASIATWLVEQGARNLTFLSRSAGLGSESKTLFAELKAMGCAVSAVAGSVDDLEDVQAAISSSGKLVKGVFQLAMVLSDTRFLDMKWPQWQAATRPKVQGTWNLHHGLVDHPLDFFWMASSVAACVEQSGQGNYSAGCAFLEAFCQYRHTLGLPATVLNICHIDDAGYLTNHPSMRKRMKAQGAYFLGEKQLLDFVRHNLLNPTSSSTAKSGKLIGSNNPLSLWENHGQVVMGLKSELHLEDPDSRITWRRDRRMSRYHNARLHRDISGLEDKRQEKAVLRFLAEILATTQDDAAAAKKLLQQPENVTFVAREVFKKICEFKMEPVGDDGEIDTSWTLDQMGLDSLMATELRSWIRHVFGVTISVLEIMGSGSMLQLGDFLTTRIAEKLA